MLKGINNLKEWELNPGKVPSVLEIIAFSLEFFKVVFFLVVSSGSVHNHIQKYNDHKKLSSLRVMKQNRIWEESKL